MRASNPIHKVFARLARTIAALHRQSEFVCADCERWARCGLASSEDCIIRAQQIERGDWKFKRQARALSQTMIWPALPIE